MSKRGCAGVSGRLGHGRASEGAVRAGLLSRWGEAGLLWGLFI